METVQAERRATDTAAPTDQTAPDLALVVSHAIQVQASVGTAGAVEYLKGHKLGSEIIYRVLSGGAVRAQDQESRFATLTEAP